MVLALTFFNGCQKDELVSQLADVQPQQVVKPDVYVENGYLAFKDMEAVDSVKQMLEKMTLNEVEMWENDLGFISAKTYFEPIFKEAENVSTADEIKTFKEKYKEVLKWEEFNSSESTFDYPYYYTNFVSLINKDGYLKIGRSLFIYNKENRITILDGDISKIEDAMNFKGNDNNILIAGNGYNLKSINTLIGLTNFEGQYGNDADPTDDWCTWSSTRRMKTGLQFEDFVYQNNYGLYDGYYNIYLWQRAQKKVLGIWVNYSVRYRYGNMIYKENNITKAANSGYVTSPSTQSTLWTIYSAYVFTNQASPSSVPIPSPMYFTCYTTNEDFNYYAFTVVYNN